MSRALGVGVIGCGSISAAYMTLAPIFRGVEMRACADLNHKQAEARAREFGLRAQSVEALLAADDIDIIVNLTIPDAHFEVSKMALEAGKHVFSEKPFVLSMKDGEKLAEIAAAKNLRVGSAPDTFLGGAHQQARALIDAGAIGRITGGAAHVLSHGMEHWHPNPDFFFKEGGGPMLDMGPYYVTNLVQLVGPVKRVCAMSAMPSPRRTITSEPRRGETIEVETPTTIHAILEFENGAVITLGASWDVWAHDHGNMELYGEEGTLFVPDPNFFGGKLRLTKGAEPVETLPEFPHPFSVNNAWGPCDMDIANYRASGLADMALSILEDRPHRCSLELALHVVDVMTAILRSAQSGQFIEIGATCERPAPLGVQEAKDLLR